MMVKLTTFTFLRSHFTLQDQNETQNGQQLQAKRFEKSIFFFITCVLVCE